MTSAQSQRYTFRLQVWLTDQQKQALDKTIEKMQEQSPLILNLSDGVRLLIANAANACPLCDGPTKPDLARSDARYCDRCGEAVLYQSPTPGDDGGGER